MRFVLRNNREFICRFNEAPLRQVMLIVKWFEQWLRWHRCIGVPDGRAGADELAGVYFGSDRVDKEHVWIDFEDVRTITYVPPIAQPEDVGSLRFVLRDDVEMGFEASAEGAKAVLDRFDFWVHAKSMLSAPSKDALSVRPVFSAGLTTKLYDNTDDAVQRKKLKTKK